MHGIEVVYFHIRSLKRKNRFNLDAEHLEVRPCDGWKGASKILVTYYWRN